MRLRRLLLGGAFGLLALVGLVAMPRGGLDYTARALPRVEDPEAFVARKQAESAAAGAWETATERLVRHAPGQAPEAILYIHGFGASRGEGEAVMDRVAEARGANLYYLRLPGHGTTLEDHARTEARDYLDAVTEALGLMPALGERVVVVGTSTGGLLATWLAGTYPEVVDALVVASPLYAFGDPVATPLLTMRGGPGLAKLAMGRVRDTRWEHPDKREGYDDRWLLRQSYDALVPLEQVRRFGARAEVISAVRAPTLGLVHYASEAEQDEVISVPAVREIFGELGGERPHPLTRLVEIADGHHVLMSAYVRTDKAAVEGALTSFLDEALGPAPAASAAPGTPGALEPAGEDQGAPEAPAVVDAP